MPAGEGSGRGSVAEDPEGRDDEDDPQPELQCRRGDDAHEQAADDGADDDSGHVFATMLGRPHHAATITRALQDALDRAGLPRSWFHDLRHAAAPFALSQGFTLEDVKQLLGHSSIVLTSNTCGHVLEQRQRAVAMGMDAVLGG